MATQTEFVDRYTKSPFYVMCDNHCVTFIC